jgi:ABC-type branched-subunit amino acid transport system ATPase component
MTAPVPPLLEVRDVELRIGGLHILRGVSFDVRENEFFTVIGPNGAGKTSLLNVLSRIYQPTSTGDPCSRCDAPGWPTSASPAPSRISLSSSTWT